MKLLSVAMPAHDVNLACCDGQAVRYLKLERTRQVKRFNFDALLEWKREAESLWGLAAAEADDVAFSFDPGALPAALRGALAPEQLARLAAGQSEAEPLAPALCKYLGVRSGWLVSHHYAHALSTWMLEPRTPDVHIVIDGLGDGRPWSVYRNDKLVAVGDIRNGSIGWGMRDAGKLLEVRHGHYNDIAGKVMGLQAYGRVDPGYLKLLERFGFEQLRDLWSPEHWVAWRGDPLVAKLSLLDWVATVHRRMGDLLVEFFQRHAQPGDLVSYSGGVAQNVIWNAQLKRHFPNLVIPPHASDEGLSLGGLEWLRRRHQLPALDLPDFPYAQSDTGVAAPSGRTINIAAQMLAQGAVLGWYQGQGEIGPRALGNRSILMDPRLARGKQSLNRVKKREPYRPFGASVLEEHFDAHFEGAADPFMLLSCTVKSAAYPAITHVDNSCRVQAVGAGNPVFRELLESFHRMTGCPVLANTSLNLAGKPIAAYPENAIELFHGSDIDAVIVGDEIYRK